MADYVDPEPIKAREIGKDVTHYPNDGHPQCWAIEAVADVPPGGTPLKEAIMSPLRDPRFYDKLQSTPEAQKQWLEDPVQQAASFLRSLGVDLTKEHHSGTPRRLAAAMKELTVREEFTFTTFEAKSQNMITLGPIPFYTMCAHHTLPFHGNAWIGYVPYQRIAGLSKFARAVGYVSKGFHVQEELTTELHDFLETTLQTKGLAVVMKAEHMCMAMRGVRASGVITTTSEMSGVFADHNRTAKAEFLEWIRG